MVYNDALTFKDERGGVKASWRFRQFQRAGQNKDLLPYVLYLQYNKDNEHLIFDKLSYADYSVAAAYTMI